MLLRSGTFRDGEAMPPSTSRAGANQSPHLEWSGTPLGTRSLALMCHDSHPIARSWVHWLVVDLPPAVTSLPAGASGSSMPAGCREMANTYGTHGWGGPQPPPGSGVHLYVFSVHALDVARLDLVDGADAAGFNAAIAGHALASAATIGTFER